MTKHENRGSGPSIVGGQPTGGRGEDPSTLPVGVERVLFEAASDADFRKALLADRRGALAERTIPLQPSEEAVLFNVSGPALEAMIDNLRVPDHKRRRFMKAVAAVSAGSAGAVMMDGCWVSTGSRPDEDAEVVQQDGTVDASVLDDGATVTGIRPSPPETDPEDPQD